MTGDPDDPLVARTWRGISSETPAAALDALILKAAREQHRRRQLVPLAAALAACLVLAVYAAQRGLAPEQPVAMPDTFGLYEEGITAVPVNSDAVEQKLIRQMPGGAEYSKVVYP